MNSHTVRLVHCEGQWKWLDISFIVSIGDFALRVALRRASRFGSYSLLGQSVKSMNNGWVKMTLGSGLFFGINMETSLARFFRRDGRGFGGLA